MLGHHKGAVAMSEMVLARGSDPQAKEAAAKVRTDQTKEIRDPEAMLATM